jgi:FAD/FMN-containing dehydrogenase
MTDLRADDVRALRQAFTGEIVVPGDSGYDEARAIWNGAIDRRPAVIAKCRGADDVVAALRFARDAGLEVSIRGGGHNFSGAALCDGGLTIDLTGMRSVHVDSDRRLAVCGGGATWEDVDAATQEHALAVTGGFVSHTGVAGLTLGGGIGWLTPMAGLSCDNLMAAEVVTADGRLVRTSESENADLLWALRGGGGNFGVVTSFEFRLHPIGPLVQLGLFFFSLGQGRDLFRFAREYTRDLADDTTVFLAGLNAPPEPFVPEQYQGTPGFAIVVVSFGDPDAHGHLVAPIPVAVTPLWELVTPIPYVNLQQMFNAAAPWGILGYEKALYLDEMSDGAIDVIAAHQPKKASPMSFVPIFVLGGAFARVPDDATAFGGSRSTRYVVNLSAIAPTPELLEADRAWVRAFWSDLVPFSNNVGGYVNFMSEYEEDRVRVAYGADKYARLARIKSEYDPDNVFHLNANIKPARNGD